MASSFLLMTFAVSLFSGRAFLTRHTPLSLLRRRNLKSSQVFLLKETTLRSSPIEDTETETKKRAPKKSKPKKKTRVSRFEKDEANAARKRAKPCLVIIRSLEGLPGDNVILDSIQAKCTELYGDALKIQYHELSDDDDENGESEEYGDDGVALDEDRRDPEMLEMWIEAQTGVLRLMSRRSKNPLTLNSELEAEILEGIAEYMDEESSLTIDMFRDDSNHPELS
mmetsp:Transcript_8976/g.20227  ORF Transcript_8976/g.20227 Transcript_8976/m.20227 type:complete len:225 (+) Transcript_8976:102-776(+)|eukprot:CAMPEP_0172616472 /NCGR_PEP_ID=MMETSP1068-20121228/64753_1 /TAXON_ID=35684 /ORGANISM="Pseudopedinella elastica, Strain CCMP716" /LENGTH=224 /DNA_ID=CAMNT_0013421919 /DNA_START=98 /DNA_END=772 /DNA_ORIENTATION=+